MAPGRTSCGQWVIAFAAVIVLAAACATAGNVDEWKRQYDAGFRAQHQGRYVEADELYRAALRAAEGLTPQDWRLAVTLNDLGLVYHSRGAYAEAESFLKRALDVWGRVGGANQAGASTTLNNLGENYRRQHRHAEAEDMLRRALSIRERVLPPGHVETGTTLNNLGQLADGRVSQDVAGRGRASHVVSRRLSARSFGERNVAADGILPSTDARSTSGVPRRARRSLVVGGPCR